MGEDYTEFDHSDDNEVSDVICIVSFRPNFIGFTRKNFAPWTLHTDNVEKQGKVDSRYQLHSQTNINLVDILVWSGASIIVVFHFSFPQRRYHDRRKACPCRVVT